MIIQDLWSPADEANLLALSSSIKTDDLGGALLAIEGASEGVAARCRIRLERWGERVSQEFGSSGGASAASALSHVLAGELSFRGDPQCLSDPRSSHLSHVVLSRRGLPILLSSIWIISGRLGGIQVDGVGLPGHFLVRVGGAQGALLDPFHGGRSVSESECRRIAREVGNEPNWSEAFLAPIGTQAIVERVLRNLAALHARQSDPEALYRAVRTLADLRPDLAEAQVQKARLTEQFGAQEAAVLTWEAILRRFPNSPEARVAGERLAEHRRGARRAN